MINLNPEIWGPHAWFFIESVVIGLPDQIPLELQNELKHFFISISFLLPCQTCRNHFSEYIKSTDIMNVDFSTKIQVLSWVNTIHNNVRVRNKSKPVPIEKTVQYYNSKYNIKTKTSYVDIFLLGLIIIGLVFLVRYLYFTPAFPKVSFDQVAPIQTFNPVLGPSVSLQPMTGPSVSLQPMTGPVASLQTLQVSNLSS